MSAEGPLLSILSLFGNGDQFGVMERPVWSNGDQLGVMEEFEHSKQRHQGYEQIWKNEKSWRIQNKPM